MSNVVSLEPAHVYEVWFRETLHEQADAMYDNIATLKRARELAEEKVGSHQFRCGEVIGYKHGKQTYEKVVGHIDGKLTWVDPW